MPEETYQKTVLNNGITVISEKISTVRSVSVGVWIKNGSRYENEMNNGITHFLEHMLFKGTTKRSQLQIAQSLESLGGSLNAFTSRELTCYYANAVDIHLKQAIEVLADMICNSTFPEKEVSKEKQVITEEINSVKDTPEEYIFDIFQEKLFPDNSLGRPILGTYDSINNFTRSQLIDYWKNNYTAGKMVISAAGNLNHKKLVDLVSKNFKLEVQTPVNNKSESTVSEGINTDMHVPINQAHLCLGGKSISYKSEKRFPLLLLNTYLGGGMSSRLFQKLREKKGLAYSVYSFIDFYADLGIFGVYIGTDRNKLGLVQNLLLQELNSTTTKSISKNRIQKIKNQLKGNLVLGLESSSRRMSRLAKNEIYYNDFISIDSLIEKIDQVTEEDIMQTAATIIQPEKFTSVVLRNHN